MNELDNRTLSRIGVVIGFIIGLVLIAIGITGIILFSDKSNKTVTTATVSKVVGNGKHADIYIKYDVHGKEYETKINSYFSNWRVGKQLEIYYETDKPSNAVSKFHGDYNGFIFLALGGFAVISSIYFMKRASKRSLSMLRDTGMLINAEYVKTEMNIYSASHGVNPYNIYCRWTDPQDGVVYDFCSFDIWKNPEKIITERNIKTIPVYVDADNKKRYFVDTSIIIDEKNQD